MFDINLTLLFQIIGYLILLVALNRILYKPVLRVLKEREERIGGALRSASELEKEISEGMAAYDRKIKDAVVKGHEERNRVKQEALAKEREMLEAASLEVSGELDNMKRKITADKDKAIEDLKVVTKSIGAGIAEKLLERKFSVVLFAFILPLLPLFAGAAEEGEHAGSMDMVWKVVNFAILVIGIYIVWIKVIKGILEKRGVDIKKAMEEAAAAKEAAERKANEYREKIAALEKRVAEIADEMRREGEAEKARVLAEADKAAARIKEQAKLAVEQEIKKAKLEIRREVAEIAVRMAGEILAKEIKSEDQDRFIKGYLSNLKLN